MNKEYDKISEFIGIMDGFQYSINIGYDLANDLKIKNFIVTDHSVELIESIVLSTAPSSTERARIMVGAYGKGKSHLVLVLLSLLYRKDESLFSPLLKKIRIVNENLYYYLLKYIRSSKKLLPVIIQGSAMNLKQAFLGALRRALEANGIIDIMPDTYFQAAIEMINVWRREYPQTFDQFKEVVKEPVYRFIHQLEEYNQDYFERFVNLYPMLTSGSEFNPVNGLDIVELYEDVNKEIKPKGYSGIFVVYDEFSKFLEGSIETTSAMDIKLLQDFAEKCNRSRDHQLHILLISHKHITNYIDQLPKHKVDAWRAVSERFKTVEMQNQSSQVYEVIAQVIQHNKEGFSSFVRNQYSRFDSMYEWAKSISTFTELTDIELRNMVQLCYPLHPITTFILPRISEKVAQNERTMFTFLSASQHNTLWTFLRDARGEFPLLTPDYIFDYFEPLFKQEGYQTDVYKTWHMATAILKKIEEENILARKIIKTIALIYLLGIYEKLPPTPEIIIGIYKDVLPTSLVVNTLKHLQDKRYLYLMQSKQYLRLMESTGVDIGALIANYIAKRKTIFDVVSALNEQVRDVWFYPIGYNDDHEITRYFDFEFIGLQAVQSIRDWDKKLSGRASVGGVFAIYLNQSDNLGTAIAEVKAVNHERVIFVVPHRFQNIERPLRKLDAIDSILIDKADDTLLHDELMVLRNDLSEVIKSYVNIYIRPELKMASYFHKGQEKVIFRKSQITQLLSWICKNVYTYTPIINNELINKDEPTTVVVNSRRKVLKGLLTKELRPNLGLKGYGQDVSIMRTTLKNTGILVHKEDEDHPFLRIEGLEPNIQHTIDTIKSFFVETSKVGRRSLEELYDLLTNPKHQIGLKKGVIPIFIAVVLHTMKDHVIILRGGQEMEINARLLDSINKDPGAYEVFLENWDDQKEAYINGLEDIFVRYVRENERDFNSFEYIIRAMQRWFLELPKYAKVANQVHTTDCQYVVLNNSTKQFRNALKGPEVNPRDFLFVKLPKIFGNGEFEQTLREIEYAKNNLDRAKHYLMRALISGSTQVFSNNQSPRATLRSVMLDWYEGLSDGIKNHIFVSGEDRILNLIRDMTNDHNEFVELLARKLTGLRIDDWEDNTINSFFMLLKQFKDNVEQENNAEHSTENALNTGLYSLCFVDSNGNKVVRTFERSSYSERTKLFYNEVTTNIEEYGQALSKQELRQVLLDIVGELCK